MPDDAVGLEPSISRSGDPSAAVDAEDMEEEDIGKCLIPPGRQQTALSCVSIMTC